MEIKGKLLEDYRFQFEGLENPVFYYDIMPTSFLIGTTKDDLFWKRTDLKSALKYKDYKPQDDETRNKNNWENYKEELLNILKKFLSSVIEKTTNLNKIAVFGIPPSMANQKNRVMHLLEECSQSCTRNFVYFLTDDLMRNQTKDEAHDKGTRDISANYNTLSFSNKIQIKEYTHIIIVDDIVTSGNSFNAVNKMLKEMGFTGEIINFAFLRSMHHSAHSNYDQWHNHKITNVKKRSDLVEGFIFDFDGTLVDTAIRNEIFESGISCVEFNKDISLDKKYFKDFLAENPTPYEVYSDSKKIFDRSNFPFMILSNSGNKRMKLLWQTDSIQQVIFPDFWKSHTTKISGIDKENFELLSGNSTNYRYNGFGWRYVYNPPKNLLTAIKEKGNDDSHYIYYSKPNERSVIEAIERLRSLYNLSNDSRIIAFGNTLEDMIAYKMAGLESVLCLWGVPAFARNYASKNWGADYVISSFEEYKELIDLPTKKIFCIQETKKYLSCCSEIDIDFQNKEKMYTIHFTDDGDEKLLKKSSKKYEVIVKEVGENNIIAAQKKEPEATLLFILSALENDFIKLEKLNIYPIAHIFNNYCGYRYLDTLSKYLGAKIIISTKIDQAYEDDTLDNFNPGNSQTREQNIRLIELVKQWKNFQGWPGI